MLRSTSELAEGVSCADAAVTLSWDKPVNNNNRKNGAARSCFPLGDIVVTILLLYVLQELTKFTPEGNSTHGLKTIGARHHDRLGGRRDRSYLSIGSPVATLDGVNLVRLLQYVRYALIDRPVSIPLHAHVHIGRAEHPFSFGMSMVESQKFT